MWEHIQHEQYKGHEIRSSPYEFQKKWKVRLDITFPNGNGSETIREYLDKERFYSIHSEAHTAGIEYGRRIIDEWIQEHLN
jgi:hypothetical protein